MNRALEVDQMDHALRELLVFSVMLGTGAAASVARSFLWALLGYDRRRGRVTAGAAVGDLIFSLIMAGIVVGTLFRLNFAAVRFYALAGFGGGLWGTGMLLGHRVSRGAYVVRSGVARLKSLWPTGRG